MKLERRPDSGPLVRRAARLQAAPQRRILVCQLSSGGRADPWAALDLTLRAPSSSRHVRQPEGRRVARGEGGAQGARRAPRLHVRCRAGGALLRRAELRPRSFLTKATAASHTMHEARDAARAHRAAAALHCCAVLSQLALSVRRRQIVKHFNSTEQGLKNYLHRHVRERGGCRASTSLTRACAEHYRDQGMLQGYRARAAAVAEPALLPPYPRIWCRSPTTSGWRRSLPQRLPTSEASRAAVVDEQAWRRASQERQRTRE